jgi:raffinose/stachyose/melibiose transport system substrate-binding protein
LSMVLATAMLIGLAACQPAAPAPQPAPTEAAPAPQEAPTEAAAPAQEAPTEAAPAPQETPTEAAAAPEERVLKVWHYESDTGAMGIAWAEAMKEFETTHPGVKIEFEQRGFEEIRQTAGMILNSDEAPDVMEYNKGNATSGLLSQQGLLTDLTQEATARGWDKILSPGLQTTCRYENGIMGSGAWYGVTNYGEYVMVYYNKDMFKQQGVEVPTTLAEFEAVMDKFVAAGITPLAVGASEYPAQHIFYELVLSKANRDFINAFELYQGDVDFHGPEFTFGADKMVEWVDKGYISKDATGIPAEDMGISFISGEYPIMISGSWWYGRLMNEITDFEWGTFLFPGNTLNAGSGGNNWVVPTKAKNKDLAYDFIDITMQQNIQTLLGNSGGIPVNADLTQITDPKIQELIQNFDAMNKNDGFAFYPDWPVPGYYDILVAEVQELIAGTKTPAEVLDSLAAPYQENLTSMQK